MNSAGLGSTFTPAVASPNYMPVVLDPQQQFGTPEIVYVTAHTASATAATVVRAQEGSALRAHSSGEFWVAGPTALDFNKGFYAARMLINGAQSYPVGGSNTGLTMSVDYDPSGSCVVATSASRYITPFDAYYWIKFSALLQPTNPAASAQDTRIGIQNSGGGVYMDSSDNAYPPGGYINPIVVDRVYLAAGTYVQPVVHAAQQGGTVNADSTFTNMSVSLDELA